MRSSDAAQNLFVPCSPLGVKNPLGAQYILQTNETLPLVCSILFHSFNLTEI
jgi:hypothetical protein